MFPGVHLHHLRDIERINSGVGVCRDEDDAAVRIYLFLGIAQFYSLENCRGISQTSRA